MDDLRGHALQEKQLTYGEHGFTINHTQCFSADDKWIVFDTRNEDTHISRTGTIGIVNVETGEVKPVYHTENQTAFGPGVGAASFSPIQDRVIFLRGLTNANEKQPYGFARRSCIGIDIANPLKPIAMDARDVDHPFTKGALRGGTHAHSFSGDGRWISYTYNDYVLEQHSLVDQSIKDLRVVGVMMPARVEVTDADSAENFTGEMFSAIVTEVTEQPRWGTDEIEKAFDETWIGKSGYVHKDGSRQERAIAFQGHVRDKDGNLKTEVFVVDLPNDIRQERPGKPLEGTATSRPNVPAGVTQRRVTYTNNGVQGPRHWLRSTKDGSIIAFLSSDENGHIQVFCVSPNGGDSKQLTHNAFSIQGMFNFSPDDTKLAYIGNNTLYVTELSTGKTTQLLPSFSDEERPVGGVVWSNNGKQLAYNRYTKGEKGKYLHIFLLDVAGL
ncbi:DUF3748 domain-containing protein [Flavisolibacter tropicus]|uniref:DUF3748 domain-containing protein n=1 Tax=Flavisolibacter tropicus TaxID=1492898 RepID=A0A172U337_9BACT|nr:DUF3748 domain-containing protein [Flavisolibacter tropicus]ANE53443.1 hypothetical protein SY85_11645 [Flavisolibacter tropicus]